MSINAVITSQEKNRIDQKPTENMKVHDLTLRGWQMIPEWQNSLDSTFLKTAQHLFNEALKYDSTYMTANSGKADYFQRSGKYDSALFIYNKQIALYPQEAGGFQGKSWYWLH